MHNFAYTVIFCLHTPEMRASHGKVACSTWGNYHFKTFDGNVFHLPYTCNYILVSQCKESFDDFNIQLQRQSIDGVTTIKKVTMLLWGVNVELANTAVRVDNKLWVRLDKVTFNYPIIYWLQGWLISYDFLLPLASLCHSAGVEFQLKGLTPMSTSR